MRRSITAMQSRNAQRFLVGAFALLLALILLAVWCGHVVRAGAAAETKLEQEQVQLTNLLYFVQQAETAQRGYLLTGDELYLAPYQTAVPHVPVVLAQLGVVTDISALRPVVEGKMHELAATVALAEAGKRDAALARVRTDVGLRDMSNIRAWVAAEQESLSQRLAAIQTDDERDAVLFEVTALLCVLAALGLAWVVMRGYQAHLAAMEQQLEIRELSTPVLQIRNRLLLLPIIGVLDSERAKQLTNNLLQMIRDKRAKMVVMDISGVAAVDSRTAHHLIGTVTAAQLMGCAVIFTGLSAEVAQSLVALGVDLGSLNTAGDLQGGLELAEQSLGDKGARGPARHSDLNEVKGTPYRGYQASTTALPIKYPSDTKPRPDF